MRGCLDNQSQQSRLISQPITRYACQPYWSAVIEGDRWLVPPIDISDLYGADQVRLSTVSERGGDVITAGPEMMSSE